MIPLAPSDEVRAALAERRAVVALESTIIAHGLPYPANLEIGRALEAAVRAAGAVPATIAIFDGVVRAGLSEGELAKLAERAHDFEKASARDLGLMTSQRRCAATTVSSTARVAASLGIRVFATGGIGGVHRGDALDVSQDLPTLAECPVAVISAGAKAILDLPRTLEVLETLGVPVIGHGTREFPAFYTRSSGLTLDHQLDDAAAHARFLAAHWQLQPTRGVLIANPLPAEAALDRAEIDAAIAVALARASSQKVAGKALTPFLLSALAEITAGRSVAANRALALSNAALGGAIAVAFAAESGAT